MVNSYTCPGSTSVSTPITSQQDTFSGYSTVDAFKVAIGPVSNALYYLYFIYSPSSSAIRKVNADSSLAWIAVFPIQPCSRTLEIDISENNIYFVGYTSPVVVFRLQASNGAIVSAQSQ